MIKVYRQENRIHETVLRLQHETHISESHLVDELRRLCHDTTTTTSSTVNETDNDDWAHFLTHHQQHLIPESAPFRHPDHLQYPNHTHPLLQPIFAARMEKRHRFMNCWHEYIYVLTPAGYLHEFRNTTQYPHHPDRSIYIPHYKVCAISTTHMHHSLVFELQPHRASRQTATLGWPRVKHRWSALMDRWNWTMRAKSVEDLEVWVRCLSECSQRIEPSVLIMKQPTMMQSEAMDEKKEEEEEKQIDKSEEAAVVVDEEKPIKDELKPEEAITVIIDDKKDIDEPTIATTVVDAEPEDKAEESEAVSEETNPETEEKEKEDPTSTDDKDAKADNLVIQ